MRTFSNMSIPDLEITREGYKLVHDRAHTKIQQLDKEGGLESDIQHEADKLCRAKDLLEAVNVEILNQK
jgi:hypothetical protein